ncbi:MAG TPA: response regulator [Chthoniobacter sp.]|jgi:two-component system chemotaxis sensor kinase CheA
MSAADDDFLKKLRATFQVEAREHLEAIAGGLLELETASDPETVRQRIERIFRAAHSLKGAARAVDFVDVESRCQSLEDTFATWKRSQVAPGAGSLDAAHRVLDQVAASISGSPSPPVASPAPSPVAVPEVLPRERVSSETVRISVAKLDARLVEAEEMLTAKLTAAQRAKDLAELAGLVDGWRKQWSLIEPDVRALKQKIDAPETLSGAGDSRIAQTRVLEFLERNLACFRSLESRVTTLARVAQQDRHTIGKLVDDLLEDSKKLLLLPFATITAPFPKLVRDLCREQGKEASLLIQGEEVELDKRILEEMKDPMIHFLRNCVDHGIEMPAERAITGKPARATITLAVSRTNGNKIQFLVSDDGAGIDLETVKAAAIKRGLLSASAAEEISDEEARALIFQSEVSTSPIITRLSGRGLGLAIVSEAVRKLGGVISVRSEPGRGTTFKAVLPAVRATFRGILVEVADRNFVVPTVQVERVTRVKLSEIQTVEGRETIVFDGSAISFVHLEDLLGLAPPARPAQPSESGTALVLRANEQRIAFQIDRVISEEEVLVKPLRKPLVRVRNIAGATVLANGQIAPILNVGDLLKSARNSSATPRSSASRQEALQPKQRTILVAEDSITSRMLLKSILEAAGYVVKTAVDGAEAFGLLRTEPFDLVVSDVEMPRMNGFDLTTKIRADHKLAELPVILVTALETREDRERGIDAGASAYLIKSNFDQSNLVEAVQRLI